MFLVTFPVIDKILHHIKLSSSQVLWAMWFLHTNIQYFTWNHHQFDCFSKYNFQVDCDHEHGLSGAYGNYISSFLNCNRFEGFEPKLQHSWQMF